MTLKLEDATVGEPLGELVKASVSGDCVPGHVTELTLNFLNPLAADADFEVQPLPLFDLSYPTEARTVHCGPLGAGKIKLEMNVGPDFTSASILPVLYKLRGTNWEGIVYLPLKPAGSARGSRPAARLSSAG